MHSIPHENYVIRVMGVASYFAVIYNNLAAHNVATFRPYAGCLERLRFALRLAMTRLTS